MQRICLFDTWLSSVIVGRNRGRAFVRRARAIVLHKLGAMTRNPVHWKGEMAWMSLYFRAAVWASLALCAFHALGDQLPRYLTQAALH